MTDQLIVSTHGERAANKHIYPGARGHDRGWRLSLRVILFKNLE